MSETEAMRHLRLAREAARDLRALHDHLRDVHRMNPARLGPMTLGDLREAHARVACAWQPGDPEPPADPITQPGRPHWHTVSNSPGYLPEAEPGTFIRWYDARGDIEDDLATEHDWSAHQRSGKYQANVEAAQAEVRQWMPDRPACVHCPDGSGHDWVYEVQQCSSGACDLSDFATGGTR